jgi:hypothetical protein
MTRSTKPLFLLVLGSFLGSSLGCYGQFALTRKLYTWNGQATGSKVGNSALMWGLMIIPVYPVAAAADFLIFNTIEFYGGSNPMAKELADGSVKLEHGGHEYELRPKADGKVEVSRDGKAEIRYHKEGDELVVTGVDGRELKRVDIPTALAQGVRRIY